MIKHDILVSGGVMENDATVQAFSQWLTEFKVRNQRWVQELTSETSIIRDTITTMNIELTDFKRHTSGVTQQMHGQLGDLQEKFSNAFTEITALVKQKSVSDQEILQDVHRLQQNLATKTAELEALKKSYSQAHGQLQGSLIQIQNHLHVTQSEVTNAKTACERVQRDAGRRFGDLEATVRSLEDELAAGTSEQRKQIKQLQDEITRIHDTLGSVSLELKEHKRNSNAAQNKMQAQVWALEGKPQEMAQRVPLQVSAPMIRQLPYTASTQPMLPPAGNPAASMGFAPALPATRSGMLMVSGMPGMPMVAPMGYRPA